MKKIVKSMATLLVIAGVAGFMGCKQPTTPEKTGPQIVEFGIWPQTKYSGDVELTQCTEGINGWEQSVCFTDGTDNYIKVTATPFFSKDHHNDSNKPNTMYKFDDGTTVEKGKVYYFKLEPIQWKVLSDNYNGKKLLFAEKVLTATVFYKDTENRGQAPNITYPNNYEQSDIRTYLNNDFMKKAFTPSEIAKIPETDVDNSWQSTFSIGQENSIYYKDHDFDCANTKDKIFILSQKEITKAEYGFAPYDEYAGDEKNTVKSSRIRKTTDYARATGTIAFTDSNLEFENTSGYWLRSPWDDESVYAHSIQYNGAANGGVAIHSYMVGVVPALSMTF